MAAVTQRIPNFLGGISQQPDDLKLPGQLKECINAYPDTTFGLIKRPGTKFVAELKDGSNNVLAPSTFNNGQWFTIFRDANEQYVGVIYGTTIRMWSLIDGTPQTISYGSGATSYLTGVLGDYEFLTINDYTFVTNKTVTVAAKAAPSYNANRRATIRLKSVDYGAKYEVTLNGTPYSYTTYNAEATITTPAQSVRTVTADAILNDLTTQIDALANITATRIGTTIEVEHASSSFTISAIGGLDGLGLEVYQDSVENLSKLPDQAKHGRIVKVENSEGSDAAYYVKFFANNAVSGPGYWEETISPTVSTGLDNATMPHELVRTGAGTWQFRKATWEDRLVGDNTTNPHPSFVGSTINQLLFYNNRLGMLTDENISFSQVGEYLNFYFASALTVTASDPVDISCSSIKPAVLHSAIPVAQGLLLFSRSQQFLLQGANGVISSQGTTIKTISNYESEPGLTPVDLGTTVAFVSKTPAYSRVFEMITRGQDESPIVQEITNTIPELIPSSIDCVVGAPKNTLLSLSQTGQDYVYLFKYYSSNGQERELQSWFKWQMSGGVLIHAIDRDTVWFIIKRQNSCTIEKISLVQSPSTSTFLTSDGSKVDPCLDAWFDANTITYVNTPGDEYTKVLLSYKNDTNYTLQVVTSNPNAVTPSYSNSGQIYSPSVILDGGNYYAKIPNVDLTAEDLVVGWKYNMTVEIPTLYFRQGDRSQITDWSAYLTIARLKFLFGLGGNATFKLMATGRSDWTEYSSALLANSYLANDVPLKKTAEYTIPIYQRPENFRFQVISDTPFPVSILSMKWEGNYSPKNYRRL